MLVDHVLKIDLSELSEREWQRLFSKLRYIDNAGNVHEPWRVIPSQHRVILPRGSWSMLPGHIEYHDHRSCPKMPSLNFARQLDATLEDGREFTGQKEAVEAMVREEQGMILAQPGFGKTNVALAFAAVCQTTSLVLVHTEDILQQWIDNISVAIPEAEIGIIQGKVRKVGHITVGTVQTLNNMIGEFQSYKEAVAFMAQFGAVFLDEAHHGPAKSFASVLNVCPARYRFGFTASPTRADGRHPEIHALVGPPIYFKKFESKVPLTVEIVYTDFAYRMRGSWDYRTLLDRLISDEARNKMIAERVSANIKDGHSALVLSREIAHLKSIQQLVTEPVELLTAADKSKAERKKVLHDFRSGTVKGVLATQLADEALDVPILSRVHLTYPGKHDGRIIQQIGRALREHPEKDDARIYDYADKRCSVLWRQSLKRRRAYAQNGIKIQKKGVLS